MTVNGSGDWITCPGSTDWVDLDGGIGMRMWMYRLRRIGADGVLADAIAPK